MSKKIRWTFLIRDGGWWCGHLLYWVIRMAAFPPKELAHDELGLRVTVGLLTAVFFAMVMGAIFGTIIAGLAHLLDKRYQIR